MKATFICIFVAGALFAAFWKQTNDSKTLYGAEVFYGWFITQRIENDEELIRSVMSSYFDSAKRGDRNVFLSLISKKKDLVDIHGCFLTHRLIDTESLQNMTYDSEVGVEPIFRTDEDDIDYRSVTDLFTRHSSAYLVLPDRQDFLIEIRDKIAEVSVSTTRDFGTVKTLATERFTLVKVPNGWTVFSRRPYAVERLTSNCSPSSK